MKRIQRIIVWLCVALAAMLCFSACSAKVVYSEDGDYTDKRTGKRYQMLSPNFEPVSYLAEKTYGTLVIGIGEFDLYAIKGTEKGTWLTTQYGDVLCAADQTVPTLESFGTSRVYICREEEKIHAIATIENQSEISVLLDTYLNGESIPYPAGKTTEQNLRLRLASDTYKHLYYRLVYLEYTEDVIVYTTDENGEEVATNYGKYFIYNREEGRCVPAGDIVHANINK